VAAEEPGGRLGPRGRISQAFAKLQFGEWLQVLFYQVARGHYFFVIDQDRRVRGFLGWALTAQAVAEQWVEGSAGLRSDQCGEGDCAIINAFAADTTSVNRGRDNARVVCGQAQPVLQAPLS
jgi:hypothetical protein